MTKAIHLEASMVPAHLRGDYTGRKFRAVVCETVRIPATANRWDEGSRDSYYAVELAGGARVPYAGQGGPVRENLIALQPGYAVVCHSIVCGRDTGLTFYVHPQNAATMLPARVELTPTEGIVLRATCAYKASHNGRDRYQIASDNCDGAFPTRDDWNAAKQTLAAKGLLTKAGAITPAGKNAVNGSAR
jgi:hypothetical protein